MKLREEIMEWWRDSTYSPKLPKKIERKLDWHIGLIVLWMFTGGLIAHFGQLGIGGAVLGASLYAFFNLTWHGYAGISAKKIFEWKRRPGSKKWSEKSRTRKAWEISYWAIVISALLAIFIVVR